MGYYLHSRACLPNPDKQVSSNEFQWGIQHFSKLQFSIVSSKTVYTQMAALERVESMARLTRSIPTSLGHSVSIVMTC